MNDLLLIQIMLILLQINNNGPLHQGVAAKSFFLNRTWLRRGEARVEKDAKSFVR